MVNIEIDGKQLEAKEGEMVIQVADRAGIYIPRFCYHPKLSIAANCRMCLVEVEKAPKTLPACATPVMEGMKVFTKSQKTRDSQKAVMEFLLINHPLDCPICDQGGQCELQDLAMGYGHDESLYHENKRAVKDEDIGPLIATEMTRCIHCTRCVRFGQEIAGERELGATGRGENMRIGTYIEKHLQSELSGNVIDVCPVGALTSKPFRFKARAWELYQYATVAPHDCLGSNINAHVLREKVLKVIPRENEAINQVWLSDRDRFGYEGVYSEDRAQQPMIKQNGQWQAVSWQTAFDFAVDKLQQVIHEHGAEQIAGVISPSATLEEMFLLQKLLRSLGSNHIDHRLRQLDFSDDEQFPLYPTLGMPVAELENLSSFLLIGSDILKEQPLAAVRLRKAALKGAKAFSINMLDTAINFPVSEKIITRPNNFCFVLGSVVLALAQIKQVQLSFEIQNLLEQVQVTPEATQIAEQLLNSPKAAVFMGAIALQHPQAAEIRALANLVAELSQATLGIFTEGANTAGAWLAGAVPYREAGGKVITGSGKNIQQMWQQKCKAYFIYGIEPELDCANPALATAALAESNFNIAFTAFLSPTLQQWADVILPIVPFTETSGTYINAEGTWQTFNSVTLPLAEARPGWKVLRVMGNLLNLQGFDYISSQQVKEEVEQLNKTANQTSMNFILKHKAPAFNQQQIWHSVSEVPIYAVDNIVRRARALQLTDLAQQAKGAHINSRMVSELGLAANSHLFIKQTGNKIKLTVAIDERVPDYCLVLHGGIIETAGLEKSFGPVEIQVIDEHTHAH